MERVGTTAASLFVNDSKATNADLDRARAGGLSADPHAVHWIVGGLPKTDDLDECAPGFAHVARRLHDRRGRADVRADPGAGDAGRANARC